MTGTTQSTETDQRIAEVRESMERVLLLHSGLEPFELDLERKDAMWQAKVWMTLAGKRREQSSPHAALLCMQNFHRFRREHNFLAATPALLQRMSARDIAHGEMATEAAITDGIQRTRSAQTYKNLEWLPEQYSVVRSERVCVGGRFLQAQACHCPRADAGEEWPEWERHWTLFILHYSYNSGQSLRLPNGQTHFYFYSLDDAKLWVEAHISEV